MICAKDAVSTARSMIGTPYGEMDCMALIVQIIRRSPGGVKSYRCQGTNWLWRSINNSSKYRHLIGRQERIEGARAGMLAFKRSGDDIHHVGLATDRGTVIHSSSVAGCVVETELDKNWDCLGQHKYIAVLEEESGQGKDSAAVFNNTVVDSNDTRITIIDSAGNHFEPVGDWRVLIGSVD